MRTVAIVMLAGVLGMPLDAAAKGWGQPKRTDGEPGVEPDKKIDAAVLSGLPPGRRLRVTTGDGRTLDGVFLAVENGDLLLDKPACRIPLATLQRVRVRGRAVKRMAVVGAVTGGVVFGLFAASIAPLGCEGECRGNESFGAGVGGALVGALLGGSAGAIVGVGIPDWQEPRHPSPTLSRSDLARYRFRRHEGRRDAFEAPVPMKLSLEATLSR